MRDEIERSRATLAGHVADRAAKIRAELGGPELSTRDALVVADLCKAWASPRLAYLKTPRVEIGTDPFPEPGCVWTHYTKPKVRK